MAARGGHLFIAPADLKNIACDAWLLPTDGVLRIVSTWHDAMPEAERAALSGGMLPRERLRPIGDGVGCFEAHDPSGRPIALLAEIGTRRPSPDWFAERAEAFVRAASSLAAIPRGGRRERRLVAVPIIGTGEGGGRAIAGDVVRAVVRGFASGLRQADIDIVICASTSADFAAAQHARDLEVTDAFDGMGESQLAAARRISDLARRGSLVMFVGAGLGVGAGLPLWGELLGDLAERAGISAGAPGDAFEQLPFLDRARLLERRFGGKERLGGNVVELLSGRRPSLAQYLVAGLPVDQAATTNYDQLLEDAARSIERPFSALPYEAPSKRWLLKMHGCVSHPDDIVLTRDDYLRFSEERGALSGVVQALLITKDMVFVGFSLEDDNFHRLVHQVRAAVGPRSARPGERRLGTAVMPAVDDLFAELWEDEIDIVSFDGSSRQTERFLDLVLSSTVVDRAAYLLDDRFDSLVPGSGPKRELRETLRAAEARLKSARALRDPFAQPLRKLLDDYGSHGSDDNG